MAAATCLTLLAGAPAQAEAAQMRTGVSVFGSLASQESALASKRIAGAGGSFVLYWLRWDHVAPKVEPEKWNPANPANGHYDWSAADEQAAGARAAGLEPIFQIFGAPGWAQRCKPPSRFIVVPGAPCNPVATKLARFAKAAATRYNGRFQGLPRVKFWQILNEPNLFVFFNPQRNRNGHPVSPGKYRNILRHAYPAIKAGHRNNVVIAAGLAPNGVKSAIRPLDFTRRLFCLNGRSRIRPVPKPCRGGVKLDIFDMHPYTSGGPTHRAEVPGNVQLGNLGQLKSLLGRADRAGRIGGRWDRTPLWVTEMSWDSLPPDPGGVAMPILKRWTSEAVFRAWQAGVRTFFWYSLRDQAKGSSPWGATTQSGLYFRAASMENDRPKPSLNAFRFPFVAFAGSRGAGYWGRTPTGKGGKVALQYRHKGSWKTLRTVRASGGGVFHGRLRAHVTRRKKGQLRATFQGNRSVPFSLRPVRDRFQRPFG